MRRRRAAELGRLPSVELPSVPADAAAQVAALAEWARSSLIVPAGHPRAGEAMEFPDYAVSFLIDALSSRESLLCMARKNGKSAVVAVLALGFLVGPLRREGWRGGVCSLSKEKANELRLQCEQIAIAANLPGLKFIRSPQPGRIESATGRLDILSADRNAGAASGFDLVLVDETGLFPARSRSLLGGLRSSISARDGRVIHISIRGESELLQEVIDRRDDPGVAVHLYESAPDCALDSRKAWRASNPGLGTIKAVSYMADEARRVASCPADQPGFRAYDLNAKLDPSRQPIVTVAQWTACEVGELPERKGRCYAGIDLGGSASMACAVAFFPESQRLEAWGAFPSVPGLKQRGSADGVGNDYQRMEDAGDLALWGAGEVTDVEGFLKYVAGELKGFHVQAAGADRYRQAECRTVLQSAAVNWPMVWRGTGASAGADGSADVRAFQNAVMGRKAKVKKCLLWRSAVAMSQVRTDVAGNPALYKASSNARIDAVQAGVIALGLAALEPPNRRRRRFAF